jgi:hypothetical protein
MKCQPKAICVALALCSLVHAQQAKKLTMSGFVTDQQSHNPIEGARVTAVGNQANPDTTDGSGSFILTLAEGVQEGNSLRIRVEKTGYRAYDKWVAVSSTIPLQVSLEIIMPHKGSPAASMPPASLPIVNTDSFSTLVPLHAEWRSAPIPMNTNLTDPHQEFYGDLMGLADRPDKRPVGWPTYKERRFESVDEQFAFVTRLVQFYVFRSIYLLQRGVAGGMKWTAGGGVTPMNKKPIVPPDGLPYPTEDILALLSDNEFLRPMDEMLWKNKPLSMPLGTHVSFMEHANPEKGEVFTCTVRLERPSYFRIDFEIQPGIAMNNQLPAGFSNEAVQGTSTYGVNVSMKYEIERKKDHGFQPDQYAVWADSLFGGLKKQMGFDVLQVSQPEISLESSFAIDAFADVADYPTGSVIGTIPWKNEYAHVQVNMTNQEAEDLSDVDLVIGLDGSIAAIAQKTNFPDIVLFPPLADPFVAGSLTSVDKDGKKVSTPAVSAGITTAPEYRIRCNRVFSHSTVQLVVAVVTPNLSSDVERHSPYAPERLPKWLRVKGSYKIGPTSFNVDRHLVFKPQ